MEDNEAWLVILFLSETCLLKLPEASNTTCAILPFDAFEQSAEARRATERSSVLSPREAAGEMGTEVGMAGAILGRCAVANAVEENGFEKVEIGARKVRAYVDDDAAELLTDGTLHHPSFPETDVESFVGCDGGNIGDKVCRMLGEMLPGREGEVIGVTSVLGVPRCC